MAYSQDSINAGAGKDKRAKTSTSDPRTPGTQKKPTEKGVRAPDDQGNAITDEKVNQNVAERTRDQEKKKK